MSKSVYTKEYKKQAIALCESLGSVVKAAQQLGIKESTLYNWKKPSAGISTKKVDSSETLNAEEELKLLRKENAELKKVNTILKAAAAFFSQDHLK